MSNADVVLSALRSWSIGDGKACAPIGEIVLLTELHEAAVRRALAQLCDDGRISPVGKRGRNTVFHLKPEGRRAATSSRDDPLRGESSSTVGRSTARDSNSTVVQEENVEELRRIGLEEAEKILRRLGPDDFGEPDLGPGRCGECEQEARVRWTFGAFELCRSCRARRARVAVRLVEEETTAVPIEEPEPTLEDALASEVSGRRNGGSPMDDDAPDLTPPDF